MILDFSFAVYVARDSVEPIAEYGISFDNVFSVMNYLNGIVNGIDCETYLLGDDRVVIYLN